MRTGALSAAATRAFISSRLLGILIGPSDNPRHHEGPAAWHRSAWPHIAKTACRAETERADGSHQCSASLHVLCHAIVAAKDMDR